jgi:hypothetical protein
VDCVRFHKLRIGGQAARARMRSQIHYKKIECECGKRRDQPGDVIFLRESVPVEPAPCDYSTYAPFQQMLSRVNWQEPAFMSDLGKALIFFGLIFVAAGLLLVLAGRTNLPIGRLPGDLLYRRKNTTIYFPLATCLILSLVVSLVLYLINHFRR